MSLKKIAANVVSRMKRSLETKKQRIAREGAPATPKEMARQAEEEASHRRRQNAIAQTRERQHNLAKAFKNAKAWGAGGRFIKAQEKRERKAKRRASNIRWSNYNNPRHPDYMDALAYQRMQQS